MVQIFLFNQKTKFNTHLQRFKTKSIANYNKNSLIEKSNSIQISSAQNFEDLNFQLLWNYEIFPKHILDFASEWELDDRGMQVGDTIVQQIFMPPINNMSVKLICGVRIKQIFDELNLKGFSYETLEGHVERGISTFTIEKTAQGVFFKIHTFSEPANPLLKVFGPIFAEPYQTICTKEALKKVKYQFEMA